MPPDDQNKKTIEAIAEIERIMNDPEIDTPEEKIAALSALDIRPHTALGPYVNACLNMAQRKLNSNDMRLLTEDEKNKVEALNEHNKMDLLNEIIRYTGLPLLFKYIWKIVSSPKKQLYNLYYNLNYKHNAANKLMDNHVSIKLDSGNNYHYDEHETVDIKHAGILGSIGRQLEKATKKSAQFRKNIENELQRRIDKHKKEIQEKQTIRQGKAHKELVENDPHLHNYLREDMLDLAWHLLEWLNEDSVKAASKVKKDQIKKLKGALDTKRDPKEKRSGKPS